MHFGEGHQLFMRLWYSFGPPVPAVFMFMCVAILGELFYVMCVAPERKISGARTGIRYGIWRYLFYLYVMMVYIQTGIAGAFWWILMRPVIFWDRIYLIPFTTSPDVVPYLFNVLMTMPLGFLLPFIWPGFWSLKRIAMTALLLSVGIEFMQLFSFRVTSTSDLIMNTLGAVIGYGIFCIWKKLFPKKGKEPRMKRSEKLMRNEGAIYLMLSFFGIVFLYHPGISMMLPQGSGHGGDMIIESQFVSELPEGVAASDIFEMPGDVLEVLDDRVFIRRFHVEELDNNEGMVAISDSNHLHGEDFPEDEIEEILLLEDVEIMIYTGRWQNPRITSGALTDIEFGESLSVTGYWNEAGYFVALEIRIMRID